MNRIWKFFSSVRLAVILFCTISLVSILGTLVIQNATAEQGIRSLQKIFSEDTAKVLYPYIEKLGLNDMYGSWWFVSLLFLFCINIIICTIDKLPGAFRAARTAISPLNDEAWEALLHKEVSLVKSIDEAGGLIISALKKTGFRRVNIFKDGQNQICAEKGRYSRLGVYVTHLSIVLIFAGAMINGLYGFNGYINILEGDTTDTIMLKNGTEKKLPFKIKCDDFDVRFYDNSFAAKEYKSLLTIFREGREPKKAEVVVNSPYVFEGVKIYQTSYGFYPRKDAEFVLNIATSGDSVIKRVKFNESFGIPGTSIEARIVDFNPSIALDQSTGKVSIRENNMSNPAVQLEIKEGGKLKGYVWVLKRSPETGISGDGYKIEFLDLWGVQYTGLQINSMPGMGVIYLGFFTLCMGLYACFFISHQRIWIRVRSSDGKVKISIAGSADRGREMLNKKIENIAGFLQK
ncbi:MAG: cytochrome c biogenesis protein ResB [Nitrospiraceae bacterium]|nr:cytochrome c biogenesis protein ResB [Nitrospiraceae bacterium]